jgi:hypothetical protein
VDVDVDADADGDDAGVDHADDYDHDDADAGDAGGVIVRGAGMATVNGAVLSGGSYRVHDMGFEGGGPLCAGTVCAWGGMVP